MMFTARVWLTSKRCTTVSSTQVTVEYRSHPRPSTRSTSSSAAPSRTQCDAGSSPATSPWSPTPHDYGRSPKSSKSRGPPKNCRPSSEQPPATGSSLRSGSARSPGCAATNCSGCAGRTSTTRKPRSPSAGGWSRCPTSCTRSAARHHAPVDASTSTPPPSTCSRPGATGSRPNRRRHRQRRRASAGGARRRASRWGGAGVCGPDSSFGPRGTPTRHDDRDQHGPTPARSAARRPGRHRRRDRHRRWPRRNGGCRLLGVGRNPRMHPLEPTTARAELFAADARPHEIHRAAGVFLPLEGCQRAPSAAGANRTRSPRSWGHRRVGRHRGARSRNPTPARRRGRR